MTNNKNLSPILIVEDSDHDYEILERAFKQTGFNIPLYRSSYGEEALMLLYGEKPLNNNYPINILPSMIILDLNIGGMDGNTLLETLKDDSDLKHIPIIVLSSSTNEIDIVTSYKNGANAYIPKPQNLKQYITIVKDIRYFWFNRCVIPTHLPCI